MQKSTEGQNPQNGWQLKYNEPDKKIFLKLEDLKIYFISLIQEIKSNNISNNLHLLEERGLIDQSDGNEEEKYSSVIRQEK